MANIAAKTLLDQAFARVLETADFGSYWDVDHNLFEEKPSVQHTDETLKDKLPSKQSSTAVTLSPQVEDNNVSDKLLEEIAQDPLSTSPHLSDSLVLEDDENNDSSQDLLDSARDRELLDSLKDPDDEDSVEPSPLPKLTQQEHPIQPRQSSSPPISPPEIAPTCASTQSMLAPALSQAMEPAQPTQDQKPKQEKQEKQEQDPEMAEISDADIPEDIKEEDLSLVTDEDNLEPLADDEDKPSEEENSLDIVPLPQAPPSPVEKSSKQDLPPLIPPSSPPPVPPSQLALPDQKHEDGLTDSEELRSFDIHLDSETSTAGPASEVASPVAPRDSPCTIPQATGAIDEEDSFGLRDSGFLPHTEKSESTGKETKVSEQMQAKPAPTTVPSLGQAIQREVVTHTPVVSENPPILTAFQQLPAPEINEQSLPAEIKRLEKQAAVKAPAPQVQEDLLIEKSQVQPVEIGANKSLEEKGSPLTAEVEYTPTEIPKPHRTKKHSTHKHLPSQQKVEEQQSQILDEAPKKDEKQLNKQPQPTPEEVAESLPQQRHPLKKKTKSSSTQLKKKEPEIQNMQPKMQDSQIEQPKVTKHVSSKHKVAKKLPEKEEITRKQAPVHEETEEKVPSDHQKAPRQQRRTDEPQNREEEISKLNAELEAKIGEHNYELVRLRNKKIAIEKEQKLRQELQHKPPRPRFAPKAEKTESYQRAVEANMLKSRATPAKARAQIRSPEPTAQSPLKNIYRGRSAEIAELQAEEVRTRNQRKIDMQKEKANKRAEYGELIRAKHSSPVGSPPRILPDVLSPPHARKPSRFSTMEPNLLRGVFHRTAVPDVENPPLQPRQVVIPIERTTAIQNLAKSIIRNKDAEWLRPDTDLVKLEKRVEKQSQVTEMYIETIKAKLEEIQRIIKDEKYW